MDREQLPTLEQVECGRLINYVERAWHLIEPARPFVRNWCVEAVCDHLESVTRGQIRKLIINIPPGHGKSSIVSVLWPTWEWSFHPHLRWMFATHSWMLSMRDAGRRRDAIINSNWYRDRFGENFSLVGEGVKYITNDKQGSMFASSTGSQDVLGFRAERLCLDDPHDPQGAISEVQRATTTEWLNLTWPTRRNDTAESAEVVVMQRLHELDASGLYLKQGGYTHLKIPMEHKGRAFCAVDRRTIVGELIDERVYSRAYVEDVKKRLGPWGEAAQYDQEPAPLGGGILKTSWFGRWHPSPIQPTHIEFRNGLYHADPKRSIRFATVDLAMTEKEIGAKKLHDPDWTVMQAWMAHYAPSGAELVLLDQIRERQEGPETLEKLRSFHEHWRFAIIAVENIAEKMWYQSATRLRLPVREVSTSKSEDVLYTIDRDKISRALAITPMLAAGRVHVPEYAPWLAEFMAEINSFPNGAHDDQCFVGDTLISTVRGEIPIREIVAGDKVITRFGWKKVVAVRKMGKRWVKRYAFSNGRTLKATPDHRIFTRNRGFVRLDTLVIDDILAAWQKKDRYGGTGKDGTAGRIQSIERIESISSGMRNGNPIRYFSTGRNGYSIMDSSLSDVTSTMSMETRSITASAISPAFPGENILGNIEKPGARRISENILRKFDLLRSHGIGPKKEEGGIAGTRKRHGEKESPCRVPASNAETSTSRSGRRFRAAALIHVGSENIESSMETVFDLTVEDAHEYVAEGILVHNCDALVMACAIADTIRHKPLGQAEQDKVRDEREIRDDGTRNLDVWDARRDVTANYYGARPGGL